VQNFQILIVSAVKICKTVSANCFSFWDLQSRKIMGYSPRPVGKGAVHPLNPSVPSRAKNITNWAFRGLFCGLQTCQKCIGGRGSAWTPLGELTTLSHRSPPSRWGGGHQSQCPTPRRFDSRALGVSILVPPVEAWWMPPADLELATVPYSPQNKNFWRCQCHRVQLNDLQ